MRRTGNRRRAKRLLFGLLGLAGTGLVLRAEVSPMTGAGSGSFGHYLADHQDDLAPFFAAHSAELVSDGFHRAFELGGEILVTVLVLTWVLDIILGRLGAIMIAPAQANLNRAEVYASGRLVLGLLLTAILVRDLISCLTLMGPTTTTLVVMTLLAVSAWVVQVVWYHYVYRCTLPGAVVFYAGLLVVHAIAILVVLPVFFSAQIDRAITTYVDQSVAPRLHDEADRARQDNARGEDQTVKSRVAELEARVNAAQADQQRLEQAIADRKNSAEYLFHDLVKLRAAGNLTEARTQFVAFLRQFPDGPTAAEARTQLGGIDQALAAQAEAKKAQEAESAREAAQARASLLARAAAGQVTLSEMRDALIGKSRAEVTALFGAPTETGANRWGYGQRMIFNPLDDSHLGLTVVFADGFVQGVDYYYGSAR
jgi:DNA-binding transcriptional regulator YdaS (Cro superfamily)